MPWEADLFAWLAWLRGCGTEPTGSLRPACTRTLRNDPPHTNCSLAGTSRRACSCRVAGSTGLMRHRVQPRHHGLASCACTEACWFDVLLLCRYLGEECRGEWFTPGTRLALTENKTKQKLNPTETERGSIRQRKPEKRSFHLANGHSVKENKGRKMKRCGILEPRGWARAVSDRPGKAEHLITCSEVAGNSLWPFPNMMSTPCRTLCPLP